MNPYAKYKEQSIMTMTPGEMVVRLFEEIIKQLTLGKAALKNHKFAEANSAFIKSQDILRHLKGTLNMQYPISANLAKLYDFFIFKIIECNMKKQDSDLDAIISMLSELKDSFAKAEKLARME